MFKKNDKVLQNWFFMASVMLLVIVPLVVLFVPWMSDTLQAKTLYDPTRPPGVIAHQATGYTQKIKSPWRLSSTLIAKQRKIATINGKLIRQGEHINGALLIDIQRWNVTLQRNNKIFKVYMFGKGQTKKIVR